MSSYAIKCSWLSSDLGGWSDSVLGLRAGDCRFESRQTHNVYYFFNLLLLQGRSFSNVNNFVREKGFTKVVEHGYHVDKEKSSFVMQILEDTIKIQSIADGQLSSPIFGNMIGYTWCASKLWNERYIFINVIEVCFPADILKTPSSCTKSSYICCSRCRNISCFSCLYDN